MGLWDKIKSGTSRVARQNVTSFSASPTMMPTLSKTPAVVKAVAVGTATTMAAGMKIPAIVLIIGGLIKFSLFQGPSGMGLLLSIMLFVISGYALAQRLGPGDAKLKLGIFLPMIYFSVWYFLFQANYDPSFLFYYISIIASITLLFAVFTKGKGVVPELLGFVPAIFLFLDLGMIPFLVQQLNLSLTPLMENLILWMPWWALLGLFTLPEEVMDSPAWNKIIEILKIMGILYLVFVFIAPAVPNLGYNTSVIPGAAELEEAQQNIREKLPEGRNPFLVRMECIFSGEIQDVEGCVKEKQLKYEIEKFCEDVEGYEPETPEFDNCFYEERERRKSMTLLAGGTIDRTITIPTAAEIVFHEESFPQLYTDPSPFPVEFKLTNPRGLSITINPSCSFKGQDGTEVLGRIDGSYGNDVVEGETYSTFYLCAPEEPLQEGRYTMEFQADLLNLETKSRLQRAFINGDVLTQKEKERLRNEEISKVVKIAQSQVPAEFAGIYFDLGHGGDDIVIEYREGLEGSAEGGEGFMKRPILLRSYIKNMGRGKIVQVQGYFIDLMGFRPRKYFKDDTIVSTWTGDCQQGSIANALVYKKDIPIPTCFISDYPEELKNPDPSQEWTAREFEATLKYDYQVEAKKGFTLITQESLIKQS